MTQIATIALIALGFRYPYLGVSMLCLYLAYAKPDMLPIVAIVSLYLCYKGASHLVKSIGNENIIKH